MRPDTCRSRSSLAWGLGFLLLGQMLLAGWIEFKKPIYRDPVHHLRLSHLRQRLRESEAREGPVVFVGTSRFRFGVQSRVMEKHLLETQGTPTVVANWSNAGNGVVRSRLNLSRLAENGVRPRMVFLEVFPLHLSSDNNMLDTVAPYLPAGELSAADARIVARFDPGQPNVQTEQLLSQLVPIHGHRFNLLRLHAPSLVRIETEELNRLKTDFRGTWPEEHKRFILENNVKVKLGRRYQRYKLCPQRLEVLEDGLRFASEQDWPIAVVMMPEGPTFRSLYKPGTWDEVSGEVTAIANRHGATFINLREWIDDEKEFNDSHHLTAEGADRFTERLTREVVVPLLREEPRMAKTRGKGQPISSAQPAGE
ncbi:MAG: hypothetical protein ACKO23_00025 [Gemmataceae bacterium]